MAAKLLVENLSPNVTEKQLVRFFSSIGANAAVELEPPRHGSATALVEFASADQADGALAVFDGRELAGRVLRVRWATAGDAAVSPAAYDGGGVDLYAPMRQRAYRDDEFGDGWRRQRPRGKHGCDRRRGRGTQRRIL